MIHTERLSPQAMMVIANARQEAKRSGNQLVGTEHILIGLVMTEDDELKQSLSEASLTEAAVRRTAAEVIIGSRAPHEREDLDFTPRVQRMLTRAFDEADALEHALVEPRHIMIAMLREDAGMASRILERTQTNTTQLLTSLLK